MTDRPACAQRVELITIISHKAHLPPSAASACDVRLLVAQLEPLRPTKLFCPQWKLTSPFRQKSPTARVGRLGAHPGTALGGGLADWMQSSSNGSQHPCRQSPGAFPGVRKLPVAEVVPAMISPWYLCIADSVCLTSHASQERV